MILIYVVIRIGQAVVLVYLWRVQRNYPPAKDWAIGSLMSAFGLFLFTLRGMAPVVLSEIVSNLFLLPGMMIFDFGIAKAAGRQPPFKSGLAFCALAVGVLAWLTLGWPNYPAAVLVQNLVFVTFDLYAAYACFKVTEAKNSFTFRILGILICFLVVAILWRVAGGVFGVTFSFSPADPRIVLIATSLAIFPMITTLLTLHTSQRLQDEINVQARHDALTDAFNRRAFAEFADKEWSRSVRNGYPLSILSVDIDRFKLFNDQHGHPTGDAALIQVSKSAKLALRSNDIWCRHGGEEFVALLPNTTVEQATAVGERLRSAVEKTSIATPSGFLNLSVSIGVAERSSTHSSWSEVLATSDTALYEAKAAGRNRVVAIAR